MRKKELDPEIRRLKAALDTLRRRRSERSPS